MSDMSAEATALELDDKFHDECGLFGIWNHAEAANVVYLGLYALQHRGQESAGIASTDGDHFQVEKAMGWVADVFSRDRLKRLPVRVLGHLDDRPLAPRVTRPSLGHGVTLRCSNFLCRDGDL